MDRYECQPSNWGDPPDDPPECGKCGCFMTPDLKHDWVCNTCGEEDEEWELGLRNFVESVNWSDYGRQRRSCL